MTDRPPDDLETLARNARATARAWQSIERTGGLLAVPDIAHRWGTRPQTVRKYRKERADFPEPVLTAGGSDLWLAADIDHWRATPRRRGRPPKSHQD